MKKVALKLVHLWILCALVIGWVWLFAHVFEWDRKYQIWLIAFALAPIGEELFYRGLPVYLERRFPKLGWFPGILANFFFINLHVNNYPYAGWYWAFAIQGVMGFACLYVCRKYGVWASIILHSKYNIAVAFII